MISVIDQEGVLDSGVMQIDSPEYESLREHYLFSALEQSDFDGLVTQVTLLNLDKGEVLFHRGDRSQAFFFVDSGQIELSLNSPTGEKKILEVIQSGRTFAEAVAFMRGGKYPVTAEVLQAAKLCQIPNAHYLSLLTDNPNACLRLLSDISQHLHARVREIERLTVQNARSRLISYLLDHIVESGNDEATVRLELPKHVIASRLSIQPETLSRLLRSMSDDGQITIEDKVIFIRSLERLRPYD